MEKRIAVIIGGGPAGLSSAYSLLKYTNDIKPVIIEENDCVGGLSRTLIHNNNGIDIGPHRFFTRNNEVFQLWNEFLNIQDCPAIDDKLLNRFPKSENGKINPEIQDNVFLKRKRFSRIYYNKHFIDYPIKINLAIFKALGLKKTVLAGLSYIKSCLKKQKEINLESFMINRFGKVLYQLFFENYTEKVWGVHPNSISKEWGEQRIKKISVFKVLKDTLLTFLKINFKKETSLIDEYYYPKFGSSQIYNLMAEKIKEMGGEIILNTKVVKIHRNGNEISYVEYIDNQTNEVKILKGDLYISSMPVKDLITNMNEVPAEIKDIADNLPYRDFILVNFILNNINLKNNTKHPTINNIAPDSWIYLQDTGIKAGRLDIMNNFSPYIINNFKEDTIVSLEYFCNENDEFWNKSDNEIINFAAKELVSSDIANISYIKDIKCFRIKKAYPAYFGSYSEFNKIQDYINKTENLYCIGRNGQHKYNNMDHSVLSGIVAAKIIINNIDKNSLWDVNTDNNYQETK